MLLRYLKCLSITATGWAAASDENDVLSDEDDVLVGGQAVIEGVMMRSPQGYSVAVRKSDGTVSTTGSTLRSVGEKWPIFKAPFIRGIGVLAQALVLGIKALKFSAEEALDDDPESTKSDDEPKSQSLFIALNLVVALGVNLILFIGLPLLFTRLIQELLGFEHFIAFNAIDGVLRLAIFVAFLFSVSLMEDMRRVFEYHGAEHKTVYTFEAKEELLVENARKYSTLHPRCGTSFLFAVMGVSILVFSLFHFDGFVAKLLSRIVLLPLVAGIAYEIIRYAARNPDSIVRWVTIPGLWLQKITTNEPDEDQLNVAIVALEAALAVREPES